MLFEGAIRNICVRYLIDHDPDHTKAVFVAGMGRSGTTWLAELLNFRNEYRMVFEPFYHERVALAVNFRTHQYLRPDNADPHFLMPARAILTGLVRDEWVDRFNRRFISGRRLVKDVRTNLMLGWLHDRFAGMPIVLIVRHPFAVAASLTSHDHDVDLEAEFWSQPELVEDYLQPYRDLIAECRTPFERAVAAWCIEVGVPLTQFRDGGITVVTYEQLCTQPVEVLTSIFTALGRSFDSRALRAISKPSAMTYSKPGLAARWKEGSKGIVGAWRESVTRDQIRRGLQLLQSFGLGALYGEDPLPLPDGLTKVCLQRAPLPARSSAAP